MTYLAAMLVSLALLAGFVALTEYEARRGMRFFGDVRAKFDKDIERMEFVWSHIDLGSFVQDELRHAAHRFGHEVAHLSLQAVRAVERFLTRTVRYLRARSETNAVPRESSREFVKTLSDFKGNLKATHPDVSDIG